MNTVLKNIVAFGCGIVFSLGLLIAQMTNPQKVLAFLDVAGQWDPSLALVMAGALITLGLLQRFVIFRRSAPLLAPKFQLPEDTAIDRRLLFGAAIFGVGWGMLGFCPGPVFVAISYQPLQTLLFLIAMCVGIRMYSWLHG